MIREGGIARLAGKEYESAFSPLKNVILGI